MNATFKPNNKKNNEYGKCGKIKKHDLAIKMVLKI